MDTNKTPPEPGPQDADLLGAWLLQSVRELDADGNALAEPYGEHPLGRLHYGPAHEMAVVIREHAEAPAVAYIGHFDFTPEGLLRHVVHIGLPPFTEDQVRWARFEGNYLVLATDAEGRARVELQWART